MIDWRKRLFNLLNRPLFGTKVIPPAARVDPSQFPEDEFPVYCTKCRYLLRGLPDGRCPECGEPFDRGRLLIVEYVLDWQRHPDLRPVSYWSWGLIVALLVLPFATKSFQQWYIESRLVSSPTQINSFVQSMGWILLLAASPVILCIAFLLSYRRTNTAFLERDQEKASPRNECVFP